MAPIRPAWSLPPGDSDGMGPHGMPHAELEDARKSTLRRFADHERLEDAETGIRLHHPNQPKNGSGRHHAIGIQDDHVMEVTTTPQRELAEISCLEAAVCGTAPVVQET